MSFGKYGINKQLYSHGTRRLSIRTCTIEFITDANYSPCMDERDQTEIIHRLLSAPHRILTFEFRELIGY